MTKKSVVTLCIGYVGTILLSVLISVLLCKNLSPKTLNAAEIFNNSKSNVVEVKAVSEDEGESFGTGVIVNDELEIITNAHVISYKHMGEFVPFEDIYIRFQFEDNYRKANLLTYDRYNDLAILTFVDEPDFEVKPVKSIDDSNKIAAGEIAYAIGNASNYGIGIFEGIISVPLVNLQYDDVERKLIQCDITVLSGNSGGALFNSRGELIGITTLRTKDYSGYINYGVVYCIPSNEVINFLGGIGE